VARIWDLYLDAADASTLLRAAATLERHDAVREPLPLDDAERLLERLRVVAHIAEDEATSWSYEVEDRKVEAEGDGGRWGSPDVARTMMDVATARAAGSREVAETATAAAEDLAARMMTSASTAVLEAEQAVRAQAQRLLETGKLED
jgi:hypothetical protein